MSLWLFFYFVIDPSQSFVFPNTINFYPSPSIAHSWSQDELQEPILQSLPDPPAHSEGNSRLEKVLNDHQLPYFKRLRLASWIELKLLFRLAAPTVFAYMINNLMSLSTRVFAGHLGNLELAAASLGNSGVQLFAYGLMLGWEVQWKLYVVKLMELTDTKCLAHTSKEQRLC
ncbi:hypothetical protein GH714_037361 [Hevea brasiliensis]|uniref:Protein DETOXIFICATION n=1 Tax=Hevea brasiliensis TaxID=3981 RepID=A0A6A6LTB4_HEVBR|nr:hypothetical protein GH714_037361 [Hevea brasiliensis]